MSESSGKLRNLAELLEVSDRQESQERLRFVRSLVPNALLLLGPEGFVCGLCGSANAERAKAEACLRSCAEARRDQGVVTVSTLGSSFVCPTCSKRYARREDAIDCHGRARRLSKLYLGEVPKEGVRNWDDSGFAGLKERERPGRGRLFAHELRLELAAPLPRRRDFSEAKPKPALSKAPLAKLTSDTAQLLEQGPIGGRGHDAPTGDALLLIVEQDAPPTQKAEPRSQAPLAQTPGTRPGPTPAVQRARPPVARVEVPPPAPAVSDEPPGESALAAAWGDDAAEGVLSEEASETPATRPVTINADGPFREPGMKPFTRADARYKCTVCHALFFTKVEVEACFEAHPLRPE